jgi:flagellar protein FlgJ
MTTRPLTGLPAGAIDNALAADVRSAQELRARFNTDRSAGIKAAAQEFEALFLQVLMKSMRETTSQDGLMESDASRFFTGMLDEQRAKDISRTGTIGLAQVLEQQLTQNLALATSDDDPADETASTSGQVALDAALERLLAEQSRANAATSEMTSSTAAKEDPVETTTETKTFSTPRDFVETMWPHAVEAGRSTGIAPQFLIAHAALESGWGKRDIRNADGSPSYNLFGIKAGGAWSGKTTEITTTEYTDGVPARQKERFRAYDSYAEAFADYARLIRETPRYSGVIGSQNGTEFAKRLQQAGYATDPAYAEKLAAIINGATLRQALIG